MKKLLFMNLGPLGSLTDTYYYCMLLKERYEITYFGVNEGNNALSIEGVKAIHLDFIEDRFIRKLTFIREALRLLRNDKYDFVMVNYFLGCSLIKLLTQEAIVVDIRTGSVSPKFFKRFLANSIMACEVRFFKYVTIISESLKKYLHIPEAAHLLPLGSPSFPIIKKDFNYLNIIYVGTFHQRNIVNTIYAFAKFISENDNQNIAHYTIIGYGSQSDVNNILKAIASTGMENYISYKGTIRYPELADYLVSHNVGMSYVPITEYFDKQPPTKTLEYILSGMAVIATGTAENKKVINSKNGVIIGDSVDEITRGLHYIFNNRSLFDSQEIQNQSQQHSWDSILSRSLIPYIEMH